MVTQPESSSAATSELPATSSSDLKPWVTLPTLQLPWSSATVPKVRSAAFIQKTHPAGTRPVRPSGSGAGIGSSNIGIPGSGASENVMASGAALRCRVSVRSAARAGQSWACESWVMGGSLPTESAQRFDDAGQRVDERVDVGIGRRPPHARPQRTIGVDAHRGQHGRRFERLAGARRARVHRDTTLVEGQEDGLRLDAVDTEADEVREALPRIAEPLDAGDARDRLARQPLREHALTVGVVTGVVGGRAEADDGRDVLDAGAARALLRATHHERRGAPPPPHPPPRPPPWPAGRWGRGGAEAAAP